MNNNLPDDGTKSKNGKCKHQYKKTNLYSYAHCISQNSVVGKATGYGLKNSRNECQWGQNFHTHPDQPWGPLSLLYNGYLISFPRIKQPGCVLTNHH
jgi:hypothetical protein